MDSGSFIACSQVISHMSVVKYVIWGTTGILSKASPLTTASILCFEFIIFTPEFAISLFYSTADKGLLFVERSIGKLALCVKGKLAHMMQVTLWHEGLGRMAGPGRLVIDIF